MTFLFGGFAESSFETFGRVWIWREEPVGPQVSAPCVRLGQVTFSAAGLVPRWALVVTGAWRLPETVREAAGQ